MEVHAGCVNLKCGLCFHAGQSWKTSGNSWSSRLTAINCLFSCDCLHLDQVLVLVVLRTTDSAHLHAGVQLWRCNLSRERAPVWFYDAHSVDNCWFVAAWALHLIVFFAFFTFSVFLKELNEHRAAAAGSVICSDSNFAPLVPEQDHQESGDVVRRPAQQPSRC